MLQPKLSSLLSEIKGLKHGFFTRQGGVSQGVFCSLNLSPKYGDDPKHVYENKRRVEDFFKAPLVLSSQVHGKDVKTITTLPLTPFIADGLVTQRPKLALGVLTADCVPVLWVDPLTRTLAVTHAGWRGAHAGVLQNTRRLFKNPPFVALGPSIQQSSYEVGSDVYEAFISQNAETFSYFEPHKDLYLFDLPRYVYNLVKTLDVAAVDWIDDDTYSMPEVYFSYRRMTHQGENQVGIMVSAIAWMNN